MEEDKTMNFEKKRITAALKYTIIAALVMLLFEIGSVIYIMIKSSIPFGAAISEIWTFSAKGILASMGGLVGFFIFAYFFETEKE